MRTKDVCVSCVCVCMSVCLSFFRPEDNKIAGHWKKYLGIPTVSAAQMVPISDLASFLTEIVCYPMAVLSTIFPNIAHVEKGGLPLAGGDHLQRSTSQGDCRQNSIRNSIVKSLQHSHSLPTILLIRSLNFSVSPYGLGLSFLFKIR